MTAACAGPLNRSGRHEGRGYLYTDNSGLRVLTAAASADQPVTARVDGLGRVVVDSISVKRKVLPAADLGANGQPSGHFHPDAVTSASAVAGGGGVAEKTRVEGTLGARALGAVRGAPGRLEASARASHEKDYDSLSARVGAEADVLSRSVTLGAFVGAGRDRITPVEVVPGQETEWPATHRRLTGGVAASWVATSTVVLRGGAGATLQRGTLSNPYRRAAVVGSDAPGIFPSLFPERLPHERDRLTTFAGIDWSVAPRTALRLQQGAYVDSWGVRAIIPEIAVAQHLVERVILMVRYRAYVQSAADFHRERYVGLDHAELSGDPRLGRIIDHSAGIDARMRLGRAADVDKLWLSVGYDISFLTLRDMNTDRIVSHIPTVALGSGF